MLLFLAIEYDNGIKMSTDFFNCQLRFHVGHLETILPLNRVFVGKSVQFNSFSIGYSL